jgi:hypothetical protein
MARLAEYLILAAICVVVATGGARAQEQGDPRGEPRDPYAGVTLRGGEPPAPKQPPAGLQYITWPGFRPMDEKGSEVFLQLTGPVEYKVRRRGRTVLVDIKKVLVHLKNNLRPIITTGFPETPVTRFKLRQLKGDRMRLEIKLRERVKPSVSLKRIDPYHYLVVRFPPARR